MYAGNTGAIASIVNFIRVVKISAGADTEEAGSDVLNTATPTRPNP